MGDNLQRNTQSWSSPFAQLEKRNGLEQMSWVLVCQRLRSHVTSAGCKRNQRPNRTRGLKVWAIMRKCSQHETKFMSKRRIESRATRKTIQNLGLGIQTTMTFPSVATAQLVGRGWPGETAHDLRSSHNAGSVFNHKSQILKLSLELWIFEHQFDHLSSCLSGRIHCPKYHNKSQKTGLI